MDAQALDRALTRIAHQILERNHDLHNFGIVGMQTRGVFLAQRIAKKLGALEGIELASGVLDVTLYRDDYRTAFKQPSVKVTNIPFDINGIDMVLVDDVLYTGRHGPRGARCAHRFRKTQNHTVRRAYRPRPPRNAHNRRLRGYERNHPQQSGSGA